MRYLQWRQESTSAFCPRESTKSSQTRTDTRLLPRRFLYQKQLLKLRIIRMFRDLHQYPSFETGPCTWSASGNPIPSVLSLCFLSIRPLYSHLSFSISLYPSFRPFLSLLLFLYLPRSEVSLFPLSFCLCFSYFLFIPVFFSLCQYFHIVPPSARTKILLRTGKSHECGAWQRSAPALCHGTTSWSGTRSWGRG